MAQLRSIQFLRGVACCAVVFLHVRFTAPIAGFEESWARLGAAGVDLFFVISGLIMATIAKPSPTRFLFDRFWRVMPLWWVVALPWLLFVPFSWETLSATLTLWPVYSEFTKPALGVGWTLSFEMLFYLTVALAVRFGWRLPLCLFGFALVGGLLFDSAIFDWTGNPIIFEFLFGVVVARLPKEERLGLPLIGLAALLFAVSPLSIYPWEVAINASVAWIRTIFWGVPAALLVYGSLCAERRFAKVPVVLGAASYSIYLTHLAVVLALDLYWPIEFALAVGAGFLVWKVVERPILRAKPQQMRGIQLRLAGWSRLLSASTMFTFRRQLDRAARCRETVDQGATHSVTRDP